MISAKPLFFTPAMIVLFLMAGLAIMGYFLSTPPIKKRDPKKENSEEMTKAEPQTSPGADKAPSLVNVPEPNQEGMELSVPYLRKCTNFLEAKNAIQTRCERTFLSQNEIALRLGSYGEVKALMYIEKCGKLLAYWDVNILAGNQEAQLDILLFCEYGAIVVEVKNWSGTWTPARGQGRHNPNRWEKLDDHKVKGNQKSPFAQVQRATQILRSNLNELTQKDIPVYSAVFFVSSDFNTQGIDEDRAKILTVHNVVDQIKMVTNGETPDAKRLDPMDLATIVQNLDLAGYMPEFFHSGLFSQQEQPGEPI